MHIRQVNTTSN